MTRRQPKNGRAFTILELIVVVAITALIIGMLLPSLKRSLSLAASTICMHNMKELSHGLTLYELENDGWLPMAGETPSTVASSPSRDVWFVKLFPAYVPDLTVLSCPNDPFRIRFLQDGSFVKNPELVDCASYGINGFIMNAGGGFLADRDRYRPTRPGDTILLADIGPDDVSRASHVDPVVGPYRNASRLTWDDGFDAYDRRPSRPWVTARHGYGINILTLEGEVREVSTVEAIRSQNQRFYRDCAAGGCTLCRELRIPHYSFSRSRLFWWTGPMPKE